MTQALKSGYVRVGETARRGLLTRTTPALECA